MTPYRNISRSFNVADFDELGPLWSKPVNLFTFICLNCGTFILLENWHGSMSRKFPDK